MSRNKDIKKVESLIRKLDDYSGKTRTPEEITKYISSLRNTIDSMIPDYLYKYRSGNDNNINALKEEKLYLSQPSGFNDPTESMAYVNTDALVMWALNIPNESSLFSDCTDEDLQENYLLKRTEIMNYGLNYIQSNRKRVKIGCLSEVIDSPLMWSHYANEHTGFAIRYKTSDITFPECNNCSEEICTYCRKPGFPFYPVIYKDKRYDASTMAFARAIYKEINETSDDGQYPFPILTVLQKSKAWEYEKEWRIVCNNLNNSYFTLIPDALFLGELISADLACELSHIAHEKGIPLYKMNINYYSPDFNLEYDDWSDYSDEDIEFYTHTDAPEFG